jgi:uncharacterized protein (DUF924 family)
MRNFFDDAVAVDARAGEVLRFWFCEDENDATTYGTPRDAWFEKSDAFDARIRTQFLSLVDDAAAGRLMAWQQAPRSALALIVLLDQFPRNLFRGLARAFAGDALAREVARGLLTAGDDLLLLPVERLFVYLPLEHSEDLRDQEEGVTRMRALSAFPETKNFHEWAVKHRDIIARFGRFPHRNIALKRASTDEEIAFLATPGSSF